MTPEAALASALADPPAALGVAVSGGGDSMALLALAADWARPRGLPLRAVTVDHGLRPEARAEAAGAAALAGRLGVPHEVLAWSGWDGKGNLMERARSARAGLIAGWARRHGLPAVALAHTMDDQAETLLLNLARGSGVDGLSAMPAVREEGGLLWLRPLLGTRREALRAFLRGRNIAWADDPSNEDLRFDRIRIRRAVPALGLDVPRLAATATRMQEARAALHGIARAAAHRLCRIEAGDLLADSALLVEPVEIRDRILAAALAWAGGSGLRPRRDDLTRLVARLEKGEGGTLSGCLVTGGTQLRIAAEPARVAGLVTPAPGVWDGRWRLSAQGETPRGMEIRALGAAGLAARSGWRASGLPRRSALALPSLWDGERLVFAPFIDPTGPFRAELDTSDVFCLGNAH